MLIHTDDLDFYINLNEFLTKRIDFHKARINSTIESAKFSDQAYITLRNRLVWVGADNATWDSTHCSDAGSKGIDYSIVSCESSCG